MCLETPLPVFRRLAFLDLQLQRLAVWFIDVFDWVHGQGGSALRIKVSVGTSRPGDRWLKWPTSMASSSAENED